MQAARVIKMAKFLAAGLPSFAIAVPLNWLLAVRLRLPAAPVYAAVLLLQVTVNFWMCKWFVFERRSASSLWREFTTFFAGIALFRAADWGVYVLLVRFAHLYPVLVQLFNVVLFSVLKFLFSEKALEGRAEQAVRPGDRP